jgi:exopolyphosphatase/guanosine-5'-triphosphate,3'-diphosphate pyrophosphatase
MLVLGCRGGLFKMAALLDDDDFRTALLALRLAVLFHHARIAIDAPRIALAVGSAIRFAVPPRWLKAHPLTAHLLERERGEWAALDHRWTTARGADDGRRPRSAA